MTSQEIPQSYPPIKALMTIFTQQIMDRLIFKSQHLK